MKRVWATLVVLSAITFGGCFFPSLDSLTGPTTTSDSGVDANPSTDASTDVAVKDVAPDALPSGDAGAWTFVASDEISSQTSAFTVVSSATVLAGDLVIAGCVGSLDAQYVTMKESTSTLAFNIVGQFSDGAAYESELGWAVASSAIPSLKVNFSPEQSSASFMDCAVNVYRGGNPNVTMVDYHKTIGADNSGKVVCGPIATAPGGIAYYYAARTTCVGAPEDPSFTQRENQNGNPNGDVVPTDGGIVQSTLGDCNGSTSDWICLMMSLSP